MRQLAKRIFVMAVCIALVFAGAGETANAQLIQRTKIVENGSAMGAPTNTPITGSNFLGDTWGVNTETQVKMNLPPTGTGFTWGSYESSANIPPGGGATKTISSTQFLGGHDAGNGVFLFYNWAAGQYFYTIFSATGTKTPNQYVDLSGPNAQIGWNNFAGANIAAGTIKIRWMVRTNNNSQWYVSDACDLGALANGVSTAIRFPASARTWYAVTSTVNSNLNLLAKNDETALGYATTPSTPNLSKVDGGGFIIDTGLDPGPGSSFKPSRLTFDSGIPELRGVSAPTYGLNTNATVIPLVIGLGANTGNITLSNVGGGTINVKSFNVASPDGKITAVSTTLPGDLVAGATGSDINVTFAQTATEQTTATLSVTWGYTGLANDKITTFPIVGRGVIDGTIYESFNRTNATMAAAGANESPQVMNSPIASPVGTGFKWGAYTHATSTIGGRHNVYIDTNRMTYPGAADDDAGAGAAYAGSYSYTIFDSMGGTTVDHTLQLNKLQFYTDNIPKGSALRWLIRDNAGHWFLSKNVTTLQTTMINTYTDIPLSSLTLGWLRVDTAAEDDMNQLDADALVPIQSPSGLPAGTPDMTKITGGGIFIEQGNTTADQTAMTYPDLNWIDNPTNGDTMRVTKTNLTETVPVVPNRRVRLGALNFNLAVGKEVSLDGVDVTVSPSAAGLRKVFLYNDVNNDGLLNDAKGNAVMDDACLTNCTINGATAQLSFRSNQLIVKGVPLNMILAAQFDDTAPGKSYTFSIAPSGWRQNTAFGGTGDTVINSPSPISAAVTVQSVDLPSTTTLILGDLIDETWGGMGLNAIPRTPTTGALTGTDTASWAYGWANATMQANAQVVNKNSSVMVGVDVSTMTTELNPYSGQPNVWLTNNMPFASLFGYDDTRLIKVDFDLYITWVTSQFTQPTFSGRVLMDFSNFNLRLADSSGSNYYDFIVYPLPDTDRFFFSINSAVAVDAKPVKQFEYAPANILAYSTGNGTGTYHFTLYLSPDGDNTIVRVFLQHKESGKTLSWTTKIEGVIPNVKSLRLGWNAWSNCFVDNVTFNTYSFRVNPVKRWTLFE